MENLNLIRNIKNLPITDFDCRLILHLLTEWRDGITYYELMHSFRKVKNYNTIKKSIERLKTFKVINENLSVNINGIQAFTNITPLVEVPKINVLFEGSVFDDISMSKIDVYRKLPTRFTPKYFQYEYTKSLKQHPKTAQKFLKLLKERGIVRKVKGDYFKTIL